LANFANLTAQLNLNIQNFARNMQKASTLANKFASNLQGKINTGMVDPTKQAKFEFKDVARIVQGIIVSKIFYSSLNSIRRATDAVWEFSKELEYAKMVYSNLFGDTELAQEFINVLKDFAAVTPFPFKQAEEAAKRLLAYGIESKNVMFLMQGVLSAATVQGTDAVIEPISRAMGQIYTKGRLMNEEMRQLAEAGIPVYEILQEKLNLTAEELRNLGRTAIPAHIALNALVEGINERYNSTLKFASTTTQGIIGNIVDNSTMLFAGIFEPFTEYLRGALGRFGEFINELRSIYELKGIGGVFEKLIPPALQQDIKIFIANLKILWDIIKSGLASAFRILGSLLKGLLYAFNALAPAIYTVVGTLAGLLKIIASNEKLMKGLTTAILAAAAAWAVYKLKAIAASITTVVIKGIVGAIKVLVAAMNFVVYHPIWAILALGVGIFIALTGASDKFRDSINKLFSGFTKLSGMDSNKMLLPDSKDRASDLDKFNKALDGTKKGMDDLASATGNATKAAKSLLGFDEVFSLKRPDEGNAADQWEDFIDSFDGASLDLSDMQIEFPDVNEVASNFVDNLIEELGGKDKLLGAGIGGLFGAALGTIFGNTKIGALIGAIAGWFWDDLAKQLGLTDVGTVALPISTGLGAAIGFIVGGPAGALVGGGIGLLAGWLIDEIAKALETGDWSTVALAGGTGLGAAIGFIAGGPAGALVGGGIGLLAGWLINEITKALETGDWSTVALAGGTGLGAAIGFIAGGPAGALVGGGIGLLAGWLIDEIAKALETGDWSPVALAGGTGLGAAIGMIAGGPAGALVGGGIGALVGWIVSKFIEADWSKVLDGFLQPWSDFASTISWWFSEIVWEPIKEAWDNGDWPGLGLAIIKGIVTGLFGALATIGGAILSLFEAVWNAICEIFGIHSPAETMKPVGENIVLGILEGLLATISTLITGLVDLGVQVFTTVSTWMKDTWEVVSSTFQDIWGTIKEKLSGAWNSVKEFFQKIWDTIKEKLSGAWSSVTEFFSGMHDTIRTKITDMYESVKSGISNIYKAFKNWISDMWDNVFGKFFDWIGSAIGKLKDFFGLNSKAKTTDTSYATTDVQIGTVTKGHKVGGIFNREHIARFAEGNKAEAIIPLENEAAMKPFVDAVSNGLTSALMPLIANISVEQQSQLQPLYVGTLIADERGLKELSRKMEVIQLEEKARRG
jgi:tape measure domain-containing protein